MNNTPKELVKEFANMCNENNIHVSGAEMRSYNNAELKCMIHRYSTKYHTNDSYYTDAISYSTSSPSYYLYNTCYSKNNILNNYGYTPDDTNIPTYNFPTSRSNHLYYSRY